MCTYARNVHEQNKKVKENVSKRNELKYITAKESDSKNEKQGEKEGMRRSSKEKKLAKIIVIIITTTHISKEKK